MASNSTTVAAISPQPPTALSMDSLSLAQYEATPAALQPDALQRSNNQKLDSHKQAIYQFYMVEGHTLKDTMEHLQATRGLMARSVT